MAYYNSQGGFCNFTTGERVPFVPPTAIYCDDCGKEEAGLVPWEAMRWPIGGAKRMQADPWKWSPVYGGAACCTACGKAGI